MFQSAPIDLACRIPAQGSIRTIPELVEYNARVNPDYLFCIQAQSSAADTDCSLNLRNITHLQLKHAILRCSEWFADTSNIEGLQPPHTDSHGGVVKSRPVALLMNSNVGLLFHIFSLMGLGIPVVLLSARLSAAAIHSLLLENSVSALVVSPNLQVTAEKALTLLKSSSVPCSLHIHLPYSFFLEHQPTSLERTVFVDKHYVCDNDRNVLILHSSGTTGLPKSIPHAHRYLLGYSTCHDFPDKREAQGLNMTTLPLYHAWGLVPICLSLSIGKAICLPVPSTIPTAVSVLELLNTSQARSLMTVPSTLEEIFGLMDKEGIHALKNLDFVACGGGPLKPSIAEGLTANGVKIVNSFGTTEVGPLSVLFVPRIGHDWQYFRLRNDLDVEIRPISNDTTDPRTRCHLIVRPAGWESIFQAGDEFVRNPNNTDREFAPAGRTDDVIVLATGEKVCPGPIEALLCNRDDVRAAVAFGDGHFQLGVLIEPMAPLVADMHPNFVSSLWPSVVEAGLQMDDHARISAPEAILILDPGVRFPRSDKGAVLRRDTYQRFKEEICRAYQSLENPTAKDPLDLSNRSKLEISIRSLILNQLSWEGVDRALNLDDDLFEMGMNSLQATNLRRSILSRLIQSHESALARVSSDFVYKYPTITKMISRLMGEEDSKPTFEKREDRIRDLIEKYSFAPSNGLLANDYPTVVLLTGSTGSLGGHLLAYLANREDIKRVICLIRSTGQDCYERQRQAINAKGINISKKSWAKIEVCAISIGAPFHGLPLEKYWHLCGQVTHIIHAAWPMSFKRTVSSLEVQFQHLSHLLKLAEDVRHTQPHIVPSFQFVSSISVVGNYPNVFGQPVVPEIPMQDSKCTLAFGYAEAKLVCEKMIEKASLGRKINAMIVRVGQLSGARQTGNWNPDEHFPALLKSSKKIGALPALSGTTSWLPVDYAAAVLSDLVLSSQPSPHLVYHLENPTRQSWSDLFGIITEQLNLRDVVLLPFQQWIERVRAVPDAEAADNPAKALMEFFESDFERMSCGGVILDTTATRGVSPAMRDVGAVDEELVASYVRNWKATGFLK